MSGVVWPLQKGSGLERLLKNFAVCRPHGGDDCRDTLLEHLLFTEGTVKASGSIVKKKKSMGRKA